MLKASTYNLLLAALLAGETWAYPNPRNALAPRQVDAWRTVTCDALNLTNVGIDPEVQWITAHAADALEELALNFSLGGPFNPTNLGLSDFMFNAFHSRPFPGCENLEESNCDTTIECGQFDGVSQDVNSPAGYIILNSMINFHAQLDNYFTGMEAGRGDVIGQMGVFAQTFSPQFDTSKSAKVLLDIATLVYYVTSAIMFNSLFKTIPGFAANPNSAAIVGESSSGFFIVSGNLLKDNLAEPDPLEVQNDLASIATTAVTNIRTNLISVTNSIFNNQTALFDTIFNGAMFDRTGLMQVGDIITNFSRTLYAYLMPQAWSGSHLVDGVFVATSEGIDLPSDPCVGAYPRDLLKSMYVNVEDDPWDAIFMCIDGLPYWLVGIKRAAQGPDDCTSPFGAPTCNTNAGAPTLKAVPGIEQIALNQPNQWGNITYGELMNSVVQTWKAAGNRNDYGTFDPTTEDGIADVLTNEIGATGLVQIAVCSFETAVANAQVGAAGVDHWPCPSG